MLYRYNSYVMRRIVGPMVLICFSLTAVVWLSQSLRFIDLIVNRGLDFTTFLYISSLTLPSLMWVILPMSFFISITTSYNKLSLDSELMVLRQAGLSPFGLIRPMLYVGLCVMLLSYAIGLYLLPASYREFKDLQAFIRDNYVSVLLQEGVFTTPTKGITVYIRERDQSGKLYGILVHDNRNLAKPVTMMAQEGYFIQTPKSPIFILIQGNRQEVEQGGRQLSVLYFDRYDLELGSLMSNTETYRWREPQERFMGELLYPEPMNSKLKDKLLAEAHYRLTWPLYNIFLGLVALFPFLMGDLNRRGLWQKIVASSLTALVITIIGLGMNNVAAGNTKLLALMYLIVIAGIWTCMYILLRFRSLMDIGIMRKLANTV